MIAASSTSLPSLDQALWTGVFIGIAFFLIGGINQALQLTDRIKNKGAIRAAFARIETLEQRLAGLRGEFDDIYYGRKDFIAFEQRTERERGKVEVKLDAIEKSNIEQNVRLGQLETLIKERFNAIADKLAGMT